MKEVFLNHLYPSLWFIVLSISISLYTILDGFDLGVGIIYLFFNKDNYRRQLLNAIGPVWDGNEVWLIVVFGGLFAGFPLVYANLLSLFYLPVWYLVFFLIFRVIAIEFRSKLKSSLWRAIWDVVFSLSSILIVVFLGIFMGNLVLGFPINFLNYLGQGLNFFGVYQIFVGLFAISLTALHGALYAIIKVSDELLVLFKKWIHKIFILFLGCYITLFVYTLITNLYIKQKMFSSFLSCSLSFLSIFFVFSIFLFIKKEKFKLAFFSSCCNIFCLISNVSILLFPNILRSSIDFYSSLNIMNTASSEATLKVLLIIVAIGLPFVVSYMIYVYKTFQGKVKIDSSGY